MCPPSMSLEECLAQGSFLQNPAPAFPIVSAEVSSLTVVLVFHPLVSCMQFRVQRASLFIPGQLAISISLSPSCRYQFLKPFPLICILHMYKCIWRYAFIPLETSLPQRLVMQFHSDFACIIILLIFSFARDLLFS